MSSPWRLDGQRIAIVGAGGQGKSIATILRDSGASIVGFYDESPDKHGSHVMGVTVLGDHEMIRDANIDGAIIAIGSNAARYRIYRQLVSWGIPMVNAIHPTAYVAPTAKIGNGVVVKYFGVVDAAACVGNNSIVGMHAMVAHDVQVGPHAHVSAGSRICGEAKVGKGTLVAVNASVLPQRHVGHWSIVGAGTVVVRDTPPNTTVVGVPGRAIKQLAEGWHRG